MKKELYDISVELVHETPKAWRVSDGKSEEWIPKSQAELSRENDGTYTLTAPDWLLKAKGFI